MGNKDTLIKRFLSKPKDFTYQDLKRLLGFFGYEELQGSGSRVVFVNKPSNHKIELHKPHPGNILKHYQLAFIKRELTDKHLL
jgi:hypothetical protein